VRERVREFMSESVRVSVSACFILLHAPVLHRAAAVSFCFSRTLSLSPAIVGLRPAADQIKTKKVKHKHGTFPPSALLHLLLANPAPTTPTQLKN